MFRSRSRYAFSNRKRYSSRPQSFRKRSRTANNGYAVSPRYLSAVPNALYANTAPQAILQWETA